MQLRKMVVGYTLNVDLSIASCYETNSIYANDFRMHRNEHLLFSVYGLQLLRFGKIIVHTCCSTIYFGALGSLRGRIVQTTILGHYRGWFGRKINFEAMSVTEVLLK